MKQNNKNMNKYIYKIYDKENEKYVTLGGVYNRKNNWKVWPSEALLYNPDEFKNRENFEIHKFEIKTTLIEYIDLDRNSILKIQ